MGFNSGFKGLILFIVRSSFCHRNVFMIFMLNSNAFVVHYQPGVHCNRDVSEVFQIGK